MRASSSCPFVVALLLGAALGCSTSESGTAPPAAGSDGGGASSFDASEPPSADAGGTHDATTPSPDSGAGDDDAGNADSGAAPDADDGAAPILQGRQVLVWMPTYLGSFSQNLNAVTGSSPKAFTQVSPDFYNLNYDYQSGPAKISSETYDGLSVQQVADQVHAAGMMLVPLVYAGAGNSGTDQGIQNLVTNPQAQQNFIAAMVSEAKTRHFDGWNLDFEVGNSGTGYNQYGAGFLSFLAAFRAALNAEHMILTLDIADWYMRQCADDGLVDLTNIGAVVDSAILEDYAGDYGNPVAACPATPPPSPSCNYDFGALMNLMCLTTPTASVSIGLIQGANGGGANPFLDRALDAVGAAGFTTVAVWPDDTPFLSSQNIPNGETWYSLLAKYLAGK